MYTGGVDLKSQVELIYNTFTLRSEQSIAEQTKRTGSPQKIDEINSQIF